jgi:hypothetical protein
VQKATIHPPTTGMTELKPAATAAVLVSPPCQTPVKRIVIAEMLDVTNETMKVSMTAFSPCCAGCVLCAVP